MKEIIFHVEESQDGGYFAKALGTSIITQGDTLTELKMNIVDAIHCHFNAEDMPRMVHLHVTREETFAL